jgi:hypothetical protein
MESPVIAAKLVLYNVFYRLVVQLNHFSVAENGLAIAAYLLRW